MDSRSDRVTPPAADTTTERAREVPSGPGLPPPPIRDPGGWGVTPAPDGRGTPEPPRGPAAHRRWGFWIFVVALLAVNILLMLVSRPAAKPRVVVPFSPYFLSQVTAGDVESISSKGDSIQGTFKHEVQYPPDDQSAKRTTLFSTEVPSSWDSASLTNLLQSNQVEVNAHSPTPARSLIADLLLGFGPTLLLVALFVVLGRRAARAGGSGLLGSFGRSQARRVDPQKITVTFADVAGIDEAKAELAEIVDFLRTPERYVRLGAASPRRAAVRAAGNRQDVARRRAPRATGSRPRPAPQRALVGRRA